MGELHSTCLQDCRTPPAASRPILQLRPPHLRTKTHVTAPTDHTIPEPPFQINEAKATSPQGSPPQSKFLQSDYLKGITDSRQDMEKWMSHIYEDVLVFGQKGAEDKGVEEEVTNANLEKDFAELRGQQPIALIKVVIPSVIRSSLMEKWRGSRFQSSAFFMDIDYDAIFEKC